jgi:glycosyltransferase XagB
LWRRLDIKLVVEQRDDETLTAIARMRLPARYEVIVAPPGKPSTKPRALNVALPFVRGCFVVVYDAEDTPAPNQLRAAAARFIQDPGVDCLQARLAIDNIDDCRLTKMFAIEYCVLFDIINPGLAALGAPLPLGGTSNHFRTPVLRGVGGWDAWNVTEDADLGLRLALFGRRVGAIDSDTYEEAPGDLNSWLAQRSRWLKGWIQTLIVHSRHPLFMLRQMGPVRALAAMVVLSSTVLTSLFGPMLLAVALWSTFFSGWGASSAVDFWSSLVTLLLLISGSQAMLTAAFVALRNRQLDRLQRLLPMFLLYHALIAVAAWIAVFDLIRRPFYWAKTDHGKARTSIRPRGPTAVA